MAIGLNRCKLNQELIPETGTENLKNGWMIYVTSLHYDYELIQIDDKYLIEFNPHAPILFSAANQITHLEATRIVNYMSYVFDTIVFLGFTSELKSARNFFSGMKSYLRMKGYDTIAEYNTYAERIRGTYEEIAEICCDGYIRLIPGDYSKTDNVVCLEVPEGEKLRQAFQLYGEALQAIAPAGQILNYWRVLECVSTKAERLRLIKSFLDYKLSPLKVSDRKSIFGGKDKRLKGKFNLMSHYKRRVKTYFEKLVDTHGSPEKVLHHLYKSRRCPSAHGQHNILEISNNVKLSSLLWDSLILKYLSRCAIESYYSSESSTDG